MVGGWWFGSVFAAAIYPAVRFSAVRFLVVRFSVVQSSADWLHGWLSAFPSAAWWLAWGHLAALFGLLLIGLLFGLFALVVGWAVEMSGKRDCQPVIEMIGRNWNGQFATYSSQPDGPLQGAGAGGYIYVYIYIYILPRHCQKTHNKTHYKTHSQKTH